MGYLMWDDIGLRYGKGKAPLDTIPLNRYGFGFFVGYPICQAFCGISRGMDITVGYPRKQWNIRGMF